MAVTAATSWRDSASFQARSSCLTWISSLVVADLSCADMAAVKTIRPKNAMDRVFMFVPWSGSRIERMVAKSRFGGTAICAQGDEGNKRPPLNQRAGREHV